MTLKEKFDTLKSGLVCVLLSIAIFTSWSSHKTATEIIKEIVLLKTVVFEQKTEIDQMNERVEAVFKVEE